MTVILVTCDVILYHTSVMLCDFSCHISLSQVQIKKRKKKK